MNTTSEREVRRIAFSRLPTPEGLFHLHVYVSDSDNKEHAVLVKGIVAGKENVLVRLHSECFTGDVFGSRRCDCGEQLQRAMRLIANEEEGILVYLRQEGRGIGLVGKLRAYNLQDIGYDTVDANLLLGYRADERNYDVAAHILKDLEVRSIRLLTNNPEKIENLKRMGVEVSSRVPLVGSVYPENKTYLMTKVRRMHHLIGDDAISDGLFEKPGEGQSVETEQTLPSVTLCYAQSLDGCIAAWEGQRLPLSCPESLEYVHQLRAAHDAILVGIGTVLADNPCLTVRYVKGRNPQPVIVDTRLRIPPESYLMRNHPLRPWIVTGNNADERLKKFYTQLGARILPVAAEENGYIDLRALLVELRRNGIRRLMVEGGARIITSFISRRLVDRIVVTLSPVVLGGVPAVLRGEEGAPLDSFKLRNVWTRWMGKDIVLEAVPAFDAP